MLQQKFHMSIQIFRERVAQVVEHVTFNHGVEGSSPSALTKLYQRPEAVTH